MAKEMIISSNGFERRIAILDDGVLTEYYVERIDDESEGMVGNIYKGRVTKVLPGMQSAFVAIGLERDAFLYVADVFEGDEIEFEETPPREAKRPVPAAKSVVAETEELEEVTDEEVEGILQSIAETETKQPPPETESVSFPPSRGFDDRVAELIESFVDDLPEPALSEEDGEDEEEDNVGSEIDLKAAIIEEKLIEAVHQEEMAEAAVEESAIADDHEERLVSEIRVGSLWSRWATDDSLERVVDEPETASDDEDVSDESATEATDEPPSTEDVAATSVQVEWADAGADDEPSSTVESMAAEAPSTANRRQDTSDESEPALEDGEAAVRYRRPRAEFAMHRKVRRRRTPERGGRTAETKDAQETVAPTGGMPTIAELLHEGQDILVQVAKEPIGAKGARVTSHIAIPGRYIVYMPTTEHVGVSRRIPSHTERSRLRKLAARIRTRLKASGGFIVRTAAEGCEEEQLQEDMKYLVRVWADIRRRGEKARPPTLMYREVDLVHRILRDRLSEDFAAIRVDNEQEYTQIISFVDHFLPELVNRVKLYTRSAPIFEQYGVQSEIDKSIRPRVWLKSGGYIVINQTEALVAIDVNTGKFVGKTNRFEDTITRTNMEAAKEIARQIRLRDLGGIIVLDFIDMEERKNRQKVMQVLEEELRRDRAPAKVLSFNDFGLVAITRKRVKQSLERTLCEPCTHCHGSGMVKSPQTVCYEILDEARRLSDDVEKGQEVILRVHPVVSQALHDRYRRVRESIESHLKGNVNIETDPLMHQEQFDLAIV